MKIKVFDAKFKKKMKALLIHGPTTAYGSAIYNIGPALIKPDVDNEKLNIYGIDAAGTSTLYSFVSLDAKIEDPQDVFISDVVPFYESLNEFGFDCEIDIDENGYRLSNEKFSLESEFDFGELPSELEKFANNFKIDPPKFGNSEFVPIFRVDGADLAKLQKLNAKTLRQTIYMISNGIIGTDAVSVSVEKLSDIEPVNVYGLDPIFAAVKDLDEVTVHRIGVGNNNMFYFKTDFAHYVYIYEEEE